MKRVAIIPLKSDSVRLPRKNFKFINGKSLLDITIAKLVESDIDIIIISTDKKERVFHSLGECNKPIFIFNRPEYLMGDAKTESVVMDVINEIASRNIVKQDEDYTIVLTQVTSPTWKSHRLKSALDRIRRDIIDSVISVSPSYQPNGCFYVIDKSTFLKHYKFFTSNTYLVSLPWKESIDIDYKYELYIANSLEKNYYE